MKRPWLSGEPRHSKTKGPRRNASPSVSGWCNRRKPVGANDGTLRSTWVTRRSTDRQPQMGSVRRFAPDAGLRRVRYRFSQLALPAVPGSRTDRTLALYPCEAPRAKRIPALTRATRGFAFANVGRCAMLAYCVPRRRARQALGGLRRLVIQRFRGANASSDDSSPGSGQRPNSEFNTAE